MNYNRILIIQTAFIGDVVLATAVVEKISQHFQHAKIDFLLRKGNESLLVNNPHIHEVLIWDKSKRKLSNLFRLAGAVRAKKYDVIINLHRFFSTGLITVLSGAGEKIGYDKNPWSILYTKRIRHETGNGEIKIHETERNHNLIRTFTDNKPGRPKLYPSVEDFAAVASYKKTPYITIAPASVWYTKQFPLEKWTTFIHNLDDRYSIFLIGGAEDKNIAGKIMEKTNGLKKIYNLCGTLSFLEVAALMKDSEMNYVNDSAPLHLASAMNAPVTVVFCSTVPAFGFGPLSDRSFIVETPQPLSCRPCGIHGKKKCPQRHFNCAQQIQVDQLLASLNP